MVANLAWLAKLLEQNPDVVLRLAEDGRVLYMNLSAPWMYADAIDVGALAPAELLPLIRSALVSDGVQETELQRGDRSLRVITLADGREVNLYARDITDRKRVELALREIEQRYSRLNAVLTGIARIFREALTCASEEELGKVCLAVAEEITRSKFGYIDEINQETGKLDAIAISDPGWNVCRMQDKSGHGQKVAAGFSIAGLHGQVLRQGAPIVTNAPSAHPSSMGTPKGYAPLSAFLGVPFKRGGEVVGLIGLGNRDGGYGEDDLAAVNALVPAIEQAFLSKRADG